MALESFALCSNNLERLNLALQEDIASCRGILSFRCIVPSHSLRLWLMHKLVEAGRAPLSGEILILEEALALHKPVRKNLLPSLVSFLDRSQNEAWCQAFFLGEKGPLTKERIFILAKKHVLFFAQKLFFGEDEWFRKRGCEAVGDAFCACFQKKQQKVLKAPTFLFGFSSLHEGALSALVTTFDVKRLYILSPSMVFWGDLSSDSELRRLLQKNAAQYEEALLPFIQERQKLLANSGVIGRDFANMLEDLDLPVSRLYTMPEAHFGMEPYNQFNPQEDVEKTFSAPTLLDYVKSDLLFLVGSRDSLEKVALDSSIEIHAAYTPLREVEALFYALVRHFGDHPLEPASVIVLVTDIKKYKAAFEEVFGSPRLYQTMDGGEQGGESSLIMLLMNLISSQGNSKEMLSLIRHEGFLKGFHVGKEEKEDLFLFIEKQDFLALNTSVRKNYLEQRGISQQHEAKTLFGVHEDEIEKFFCKAKNLSKTSHLSFLAEVQAWVKRVEEVVSLPIDPQKYQLLSMWIRLLRVLFEPFLGIYPRMEKALSFLEKNDQEAFFPFQEVLSLLFSELKESAHSAMTLRAPILLGEFGSFQPFPACVVAILGAEEGSLPKEEETPLKYLDKLPPTLYPSSKLYERYAFIEALLSAQKLFVGYQAFAFELHERIPPSPVIVDLLAHLDSNYVVDGKKPSEKVVWAHSLYRNGVKRASFHIPESIFGKRKEASHLDLIDVQKTAKNPLSRYIKAQFGVGREWEENESLFIKPYEIKMHLEKSFLGKEAFAMREHALALRSFEEAREKMQKILHELGFNNLTLFDIEFSPTVRQLTQDGQLIVVPELQCQHIKMQGSWKGMAKEGVLLFSETWETELFQKWFECAFRAHISKMHGLNLASSLIVVKEKRIEPFSIRDPEALFNDWVAFAELSCQVPFPFSYDIVKALLKKASQDVLEAKLEGEKIGKEKIADYKTVWEEWAHRLYGELLVSEEK